MEKLGVGDAKEAINKEWSAGTEEQGLKSSILLPNSVLCDYPYYTAIYLSLKLVNQDINYYLA